MHDKFPDTGACSLQAMVLCASCYNIAILLDGACRCLDSRVDTMKNSGLKYNIYRTRGLNAKSWARKPPVPLVIICDITYMDMYM